MKDLELLESVLAVLPPETSKLFRLYLIKSYRTPPLRSGIIDIKLFAHECRAKRAKCSATKSRTGSSRRQGETPEQAYARAYDDQVRKQLAILQAMLRPLEGTAGKIWK